MSRRVSAFGLAGLVLALDRATKMLVEASLSTEETITLIPGFFDLVRTHNRGMAFGLMSDGDSEWRSFFLVGVTALVLAFVAVMLWQTSPRGMAASKLSRTGLSLVFGGALGNLYDRLVRGEVTDFLDFYAGEYHWPAFNVADSAISVGIGLVLLDLWLARRKVVST
jgi:signal peptidase II